MSPGFKTCDQVLKHVTGFNRVEPLVPLTRSLFLPTMLLSSRLYPSSCYHKYLQASVRRSHTLVLTSGCPCPDAPEARQRRVLSPPTAHLSSGISEQQPERSRKCRIFRAGSASTGNSGQNRRRLPVRTSFDRPEEELGKDSAGFGANVAGKNADVSENVPIKRRRLQRFGKFSGRMDLRVVLGGLLVEAPQ